MNQWDDIRFFLAVARAGNITAAARQLEVNHSTVSRRIGAMEDKRGVRLFDRVASGYNLTLAGERIVPQAEAIERQQFELERILLGGDARLSGDLSVTAPHDLANLCLLPTLGEFTRAYPEINVQLLVAKGLKDLAAREADIAVRLTPSPPDYLVGKKLADLRHGVYCSKSYVRKHRTPHQVICWSHEKTVPGWVKAHFPDAKVALRVDDLSTMYAAVKAGMGLARMPCYLPDKLRAANVLRLPMDLPPSTWGLWVLHHVDLRETARVRVLKEHLTQVISAQKTFIEGAESVFWSTIPF